MFAGLCHQGLLPCFQTRVYACTADSYPTPKVYVETQEAAPSTTTDAASFANSGKAGARHGLSASPCCLPSESTNECTAESYQYPESLRLKGQGAKNTRSSMPRPQSMARNPCTFAHRYSDFLPNASENMYTDKLPCALRPSLLVNLPR